MIPHPIRLRHPWDSEPQANGQILHRRRFNRPTGLEGHEQVSLEIDRAMIAGLVSLNGTSLGQLKPGEFFAADITSLIADANEVSILADPRTARTTPPPSTSMYIADADQPPGSPVGDVRLLIRAAPRS